MMVKRGLERKKGKPKKNTVDNLLPLNDFNYLSDSKTALTALDARLQDVDRRNRSRKKQGPRSCKEISKRSISVPSNHMSLSPCSRRTLDHSSCNAKSVHFNNGSLVHHVQRTARRSPPSHRRKSALRSASANKENQANNRSSPFRTRSNLNNTCHSATCSYGAPGWGHDYYNCGCPGDAPLGRTVSYTDFQPNSALASYHECSHNKCIGASKTHRYPTTVDLSTICANSSDRWKHEMKLDDLRIKYSDFTYPGIQRVRSHSLPHQRECAENGKVYENVTQNKCSTEPLLTWANPMSSIQSKFTGLPSNSNTKPKLFSNYAESYGNTFSAMPNKLKYTYSSIGPIEPFVNHKQTLFQTTTVPISSSYRQKFASNDNSVLEYYKNGSSLSHQFKYSPSYGNKALDSYRQPYKRYEFLDDMRLVGQSNKTYTIPYKTNANNKMPSPSTPSCKNTRISELAGNLKTMDICRKALQDLREKENFLLEKYVYGSEGKTGTYIKNLSSDTNNLSHSDYRNVCNHACTNNSNRDFAQDYYYKYRIANEPGSLQLCHPIHRLCSYTEDGITKKENYNLGSNIALGKNYSPSNTTVFPKSSYAKQSAEDILMLKYGKQNFSWKTTINKYITPGNEHRNCTERSETKRSSRKLLDEIKFSSVPSSHIVENRKSWSLGREATRHSLQDFIAKYTPGMEKSSSVALDMIKGCFNSSNSSTGELGNDCKVETNLAGIEKDFLNTGTDNLYLSVSDTNSMSKNKFGDCSKNATSDGIFSRNEESLSQNFKKLINTTSASPGYANLLNSSRDSTSAETSSQLHLNAGQLHTNSGSALGKDPPTRKKDAMYQSDFLNSDTTGFQDQSSVNIKPFCLCNSCTASSSKEIDMYVKNETNRLINIHSIINKTTRGLPESYYDPPQCKSKNSKTDVRRADVSGAPDLTFGAVLRPLL